MLVNFGTVNEFFDGLRIGSTYLRVIGVFGVPLITWLVGFAGLTYAVMIIGRIGSTFGILNNGSQGMANYAGHQGFTSVDEMDDYNSTLGKYNAELGEK